MRMSAIDLPGQGWKLTGVGVDVACYPYPYLLLRSSAPGQAQREACESAGHHSSYSLEVQAEAAAAHSGVVVTVVAEARVSLGAVLNALDGRCLVYEGVEGQGDVGLRATILVLLAEAFVRVLRS
jgi:hypothetical protein